MNNEIILYQPNETIKLEVRLENESVWLTQQQIACLYGCSTDNVGLHLKNIYKEGELEKTATTEISSVVQIEGHRKVTRQILHYNLDAILSVGYRVNSRNATLFRQWSNKILKEYLMRGYAVNQRLERIEHRIMNLEERQNEFDLMVKTSLPPSEGLFFNGQIYDAFECVRSIIKTAKKSILLIDNYVDESVLTMMADKETGVSVAIYTAKIPQPLRLAEAKFNAQYGGLALKTTDAFHDRFLIIDDEKIYLVGASLKDLGRKWFGFTEMDSSNIARIKKGL